MAFSISITFSLSMRICSGSVRVSGGRVSATVRVSVSGELGFAGASKDMDVFKGRFFMRFAPFITL